MTLRASVCRQVFDGFLCPLVFRGEVEGVTGEKCVVRVRIPPNQPERLCLFLSPKKPILGVGFAKSVGR